MGLGTIGGINSSATPAPRPFSTRQYTPASNEWSEIMSKETMHNSEANIEVRKLKDELRDDELDVVTGGMLTFSNSDFDDVLPTASGANGHVK